MAFDINHVTVMGRLGAAPDIKKFQDGGKIANLRIATSESWRDKSTGEQRERTEWHGVVVQPPAVVDFVEKYLRKGARVHVTGALRTRKWQDQQGNDRYTTEIVVSGYAGKVIPIDWPDRGDGGGGAAAQGGGGGASSGGDWGGAGASDLDDDVPF